MSHWCKICGRNRPNESFSGEGHRMHVCKECSQISIDKRRYVEALEKIAVFLMQSNISKKNISYLQTLGSSQDPAISELASIVLEIAKVHPYKRKRLRFLAKEKKDLLQKLINAGLIHEC